MRIHICTHTYAHTHAHTYAHTHAHTHMHTHIHTHAHTLAHTYAHTHAHTYTHTHAHTYAHTHAHTYAHTHAHTYAHTHTHASCLSACLNRRLLDYGYAWHTLLAQLLCLMLSLFSLSSCSPQWLQVSFIVLALPHDGRNLETLSFLSLCCNFSLLPFSLVAFVLSIPMHSHFSFSHAPLSICSGCEVNHPAPSLSY